MTINYSVIIQSKQMVYLLQEAHTERKYVQVKREPPPVKKTHNRTFRNIAFCITIAP